MEEFEITGPYPLNQVYFIFALFSSIFPQFIITTNVYKI